MSVCDKGGGLLNMANISHDDLEMEVRQHKHICNSAVLLGPACPHTDRKASR